MENRNISLKIAENVINSPDQIIIIDSIKSVYQSKIKENGITFLIRIFIAIDKTTNVIITLYKTSKISKYWKHES